MSKAVVILSGGMDSTTLLYKVRQDHDVVSVLSFDYGQRHIKELECAKKTANKLGIPHKVIDLSAVNAVMEGSSLTRDIDVPEGHYADENMKATVVPNRNMIMLSVAVADAVSREANEVYFGAHSGDHDIYPDCRQEFIEALSKATELANYQPVKIKAPFIHMDKGDILEVGKELGVPYEDTWTCYKGLEKACGKCGSCVERLEGFEKAGMTDPVEYMTGEDEKASTDVSRETPPENTAQGFFSKPKNK